MMGDYRYQITEHNGVPCLHVMTEVFDHGVTLPNVGDGMAHTYIPIDDVLSSICASREQPATQAEMQDTQFLGFARLLWRGIKQIGDKYAHHSCEHTGAMAALHALKRSLLLDQEVETYCAQRAYDLAQHSVGHTLEYLHECGIELSGGMGKRIQPSIPDIPQWSDCGLQK